MSDQELPAPLVPAEVDLRDFAFMPLDVLRLRDSDLACVEDAEIFRCSVMSWCVSWHQTPAGSLPDDDALLARLLGYGRDVKGAKKIREAGGLRGWIKCADGRLYHPVVADKAKDAWTGKLHQRWRTEAARFKKHNQRHKLDGANALVMPEFEEWLSLGCPQGQALPVPKTSLGTSAGCPQAAVDSVPGEKASKGQGEGQGQGDTKEKTMVAPADADPTAHPAAPPTSPPLKAKDLQAEGVSPQHAADWLALRKAKRLPLTPTAWADTKAEGLKAGLNPAQTVAAAVANNWAGFKASWLLRNGAKGGGGSSGSDDPFAGAH